MKRVYIHIITCAVLIMGINLDLHGQSYEEKRQAILQQQANTRAEINVLDARIRSFQQRLEQAEQEFQKSYQQFEDLNDLIALQDDKIKTLEQEQDQIQEEIALTESEIADRESQLQYLIENYKKILLFAYKKGQSNNLEILMTSSSINEALVRSYYLKKFEEQKAKQAQQIRKQKNELDQVRINLRQSLNRNQVIITEILDEKRVLDEQRESQQETVATLRSERANVRAKLQENQKQKEALESRFANLIAMEEKNREEAKAVALSNLNRENNTSTNRPAVRENMLSEDMLLDFDAAFAGARGNMMWPVDSRTVSKKFGRTRNPVYGTYTEHLGINIVADQASPVRTVSDGYVISIAPSPGYGDVVIIQHGSYYTAYGNLSQVNVSKYQIVDKGDVVGLSGVADSPLGENLFFMVRKRQENLNPQDWLVK